MDFTKLTILLVVVLFCCLHGSLNTNNLWSFDKKLLFLNQPCGHDGICKTCANEILVCPECSTTVEGSKDAQMRCQLKPLALGSAFNSSVDPDVEATPSRSNGTRLKSNASMEIFGGTEPDLESGSDESSSDDEEALLSTPSTFVLNKPRRLSAGVERQGIVGEQGPSTEDTCGGDIPVEDNVQFVEGNAQEIFETEQVLDLESSARADDRLEFESTPTLVSPAELVVQEVPEYVENEEGDCPTLTKKVDNSNVEDRPRIISKRRNPTEPSNCPKRNLRKDGKTDVLVTSQKKEVLRLLADQQAQSITKESGAGRSKRSSYRK